MPARDRARRDGALAGRAIGLGAQPGPLEVHRRVDLGGPDQLGAELRRARVQAAQLADRHGLVQRVPQELVTEVEVALVDPAERVQEGAVDELLQRVVELGDVAVHDPGQDVGHEAPADHGAGTCHRPRVVGQPREAGQDGVLDGARHVRVADGLAVGARVVAEGAQQLLDVQGNAVGALVDRAHHLARGGEPGGQDQRRHQRGLVVRQRREPRLLGPALAEQARPPFAVVGVERHLVRAVGPDHEGRTIGDEPGDLADHLEAHLVGPLEVLEGEDGRPVDGVRDPLGEVADEDAPRSQRVAALPVLSALHRQQLVAEAAERGDLAHRPREVLGRREGNEPVLGREIGLRDPEAGRIGLPEHRPQQAGLADAGLAREEHHLAAPGGGLLDAPVGERQQLVATDEEWTEERPQVTHASGV